MTSNLGSDYILEKRDNAHELVLNELNKTFKPEFLNRIDEIIIFNSLDKNIVYKILDKIINDINKRLDDKKIIISLTDKAKEFIIENSYDESYGARPIKRYVSRNIETLLAKAIINNEIKYNSNVLIDIENDNLVIKK
jgi:ATP-dependent Clp protease ATP-binding subunit ClpB